MQGSDRYERTQALWHLHTRSLEAFLADYFPDVSYFQSRVYSVWKTSAVRFRQDIILTSTQ